MSFYVTTLSDKKRTKSINDLLGKPYNLWDRIQMGGIGSPRLMIDAVSLELDMAMNERTMVNYATIELRPKGILMHFTKGIQSFAWAIPFYRLSIFTGDQISIHGNGSFAKIKNDNQKQAIQQFISKIIQYKAEFMQETNAS